MIFLEVGRYCRNLCFVVILNYSCDPDDLLDLDLLLVVS